MNFYGYTKLKGEEVVMELDGDFCIARTSVLYGSKPSRGEGELCTLALGSA